ncbi:hypothetical protein K8I85_01550, partial [bacterium]|nr:hypothetical protein [bacterium]
HVLFVTINGGYNADGSNAFDMLVAAGADADYVLLNSDGLAETAIDDAQTAGDPYDQIWVYDLSTGSDPYPTDYQAIVDWFNGQPDPELICDGRFLSSFWSGRWPTEGRALAENYYVNFETRGGGLVLATDHNAYSNVGMNDICALLGLDPFTGLFSGPFPVDPANPLMNTPNDLTGGLSNDSTTGQAPFNLQPNGLILHTVGFHSGNPLNPGLSSTIGGALNFRVTIDAPASGTVLCPPESLLATTSVVDQVDPVTYQWSSNVDGPLGTDATQPLTTSLLSDGTHVITVLAQDATGLFDDDSIIVIVGGPGCDPTLIEDSSWGRIKGQYRN